MAPSKKNGTDGKKSAVKATAGEAAMKASIAADTKAANDTKMAAKTSRQKKPRLKTKPRPAPSVVSPSSTAVAPSDNRSIKIDLSRIKGDIIMIEARHTKEGAPPYTAMLHDTIMHNYGNLGYESGTHSVLYIRDGTKLHEYKTVTITNNKTQRESVLKFPVFLRFVYPKQFANKTFQKAFVDKFVTAANKHKDIKFNEGHTIYNKFVAGVTTCGIPDDKLPHAADLFTITDVMGILTTNFFESDVSISDILSDEAVMDTYFGPQWTGVAMKYYASRGILPQGKTAREILGEDYESGDDNGGGIDLDNFSMEG